MYVHIYKHAYLCVLNFVFVLFRNNQLWFAYIPDSAKENNDRVIIRLEK